MDLHVKILAVFYLIFGVLGLLAALTLLLIFVGVAGVVGAASVDNPDAWLALPIMGLVGTVLALVALVLAVPCVVAGLGLLKFRPWARVLTIVLSALNLINVPFGTVLGVYGLWVLLSKDTEPLFRAT